MAARSHANPAIAAGLAGGAGFLLPVAAYAATLPYESFNEVVRACAVPFAVGSIAGAGMCAAAVAVLDRPRAPKDVELGGAAATRPHLIDLDEVLKPENSGIMGTGILRSRQTPKDVPVIARAPHALSEAEAWAEIDSMLDDSSPISCDASKSKDIYQIAFEELARAAATSASVMGEDAASPAAPEPGHAPSDVPAERVAAHAAAPGAPVAMRSLEPSSAGDATSVFLAIAAARGIKVSIEAVPAGAEAAVPAAPVVPAVEPDPAPVVFQPVDDAAMAEADRIAALSWLGGTRRDDFDLDEPDGMDGSPMGEAPVATAPVPVAEPAVPMAPVLADDASVASDAAAEYDGDAVPMADYSGHEEMWARAIAILEEDARTEADEPAQDAHVAADPACEEPVAEEPEAHRGRHGFLRVIQGGTQSFPRARAEA